MNVSLSTKWTVKIPTKQSRGRSGNSYKPLEYSGEELREQPIKALKAMCAARGLSTNHTRKKLVARLEKWAWESTPTKGNPRFADWDCLACKTRGKPTSNFGSRATCRGCGKTNPARRQEGDWDCPCCNSHVFAGRKTCFRCGTQNPETVTVSFLSQHKAIKGLGGRKMDLTKAKTDYVIRQSHEAKQKAALREFKKQQKAAEKQRANQQRQVYAASSDSGSVTTDTASVSSFVPDVCASLVQSETKRTPERYFREGRSYYLKRQGCVREGRELPTRYGKGSRIRNKIVDSLDAWTIVYVTKVVGNRAQISSPVRGWVSTVTARGDLLTPVNQ